MDMFSKMLQPQNLSQFDRPSLQNATCVVMVPPKEFKFNPQTAQDNEFQHRPSLSDEQITLRVMAEFDQMVTK